MTEYMFPTDRYCFTTDIDWFCVINGTPIHVASGGSHLPSFMKRRTIEKILLDVWTVLKLPIQFDYELNQEYLFNHVVNTGYEYLENDSLFSNMKDIDKSIFLHEESLTMCLYARSFVEMARRGFYSFDKTENSSYYHLVARPIGGYVDSRRIQLSSFNVEGLVFKDLSSLNQVSLVELLNNH